MQPIGKLEIYCEKIESALTMFAAPPVLGAPFGLIQTALGIIQLITAIALHILSGMPCIKERWPDLELRSLEHIFHGAANIAMGILKTIPFLGLAIFLQRKNNPDPVKLEKGIPPYVQFHYSPHRKRSIENETPLADIHSEPVEMVFFQADLSKALYQEDEVVQ